MEIDPRSLPYLFKQLRDLDKKQKHRKTETQDFKKYKNLVLAAFSSILRILDMPSCLYMQLFDEETNVQHKNKKIRRLDMKNEEKRNEQNLYFFCLFLC